jgi:uncharacterized membrane protein YoaK (UPF0700 family)
MSDSSAVGLLLALVGGYLDAYTYVSRGGVFANAQTGNMVLLAVRLLDGEAGRAISYLIPILAFAAGVFVAEAIRRAHRDAARFHWRQTVLLIEAATLLAVAFVPASGDWLANVAVAFVSSLQVQSFRKLNGNPYATTMCTGNLRSASELLSRYALEGDRTALRGALTYLPVIALFIVGAGVGALASRAMGMAAALPAIAPLAVALVLMVRRAPGA